MKFINHWFESDNSIFEDHNDKCEINFKVFTNKFHGFLEDENIWKEVID